MTVIFRDIAKAFNRKLAHYEQRKLITIGYLRAVDSNVQVPRRPNYVWFQEWAQAESAPLAEVFNDAVAPIANLAVIVGSDPTPPFRRRVIGIYRDGLLPNSNGDAGSFNLPLHGRTHQYPSESNVGHDPVLVYQPAIQPLKTTGGSGLTVTVQPLIYQYSNAYYLFGGTTLDLTASQPGANLVRYVLIYLNPATGLLATVDGTTVLNTGAIPIPLPALIENTIPSAYVKIADTTTVISNTDILDARVLLGAVTNLSNTLTPRRIGDILISNDGLTFEPGETIVDAFGDIVTNANGHIVVI